MVMLSKQASGWTADLRHRIRSTRDAWATRQGLPVRELERRLGVTPATFNRWVNDARSLRVETVAQIADVLGEDPAELAAGYPRAATPLDRLRELAGDLVAPAAPDLVAEASRSWRAGDLPRAASCLVAALTEGETAGAWITASSTLAEAAEMDLAVDAGRRGLELAILADDEVLLGRALGVMGQAYALSDRHAVALAVYRRALRLHLPSPMLFALRQQSATTLGFMRCFAEARAELEAALTIEVSPGHAAYAYLALAHLARDEGDYDEALPHFAAAFEAAEAEPTLVPPVTRAEILAEWGVAAIAAGQPDVAAQLIPAAATLLEAMDHPQARAILLDLVRSASAAAWRGAAKGLAALSETRRSARLSAR